MSGRLIQPQPGPQERFLASPADIAIYGGAAGGGKTWALLAEPLRHLGVPGFSAVIFRRTSVQVRNEGGLWDEAQGLYPALGGVPREASLEWRFPSGARVRFAHLEHDKNRLDWQGAQVPLIGFDELTHFSKGQVFYLLGRNRSTCGVRPYVRATTNPDPDSWVADFIAWWLGDDGYPMPERSGVVRWFVHLEDVLYWDDSPEALRARLGDGVQPKSATFIAANVHDNRVLLDHDPAYLANLDALPRVERERLKHGNWHARADAGTFFRRAWLPVSGAPPADGRRVRAWDLAASPDGDWTVGVRLARDGDGVFHVEDVERLRGTPGEVERAVQAVARRDGTGTTVVLPRDPGQAGVAQVRWLAAGLPGYTVRARSQTSSKQARAAAVSAQAEAGNLRLVDGPWVEPFIKELEAFPQGARDDQVDALATAFNALCDGTRPAAGQGRIKGVY